MQGKAERQMEPERPALLFHARFSHVLRSTELARPLSPSMRAHVNHDQRSSCSSVALRLHADIMQQAPSALVRLDTPRLTDAVASRFLFNPCRHTQTT